MSAFVLLCVCLALGFALARLAEVPPGAPTAINFWVLNVALSTVGVAVAAHSSGTIAHPVALLRRVLLFPAFLALIAAMLVRAAGGWPPWCVDVLARLGDTLTPLALFSVGLQFRFGDLVHH